MDFDDIVIGSGLAALGTVLGLEQSRRVLVLCGRAQGVFSYYDERGTVPCSYTGAGGLGNDWHGVIPVALHHPFGLVTAQNFRSTFSDFYPNASIDEYFGSASLFVPWRPIRPRSELGRIAGRRAGRLVLLPEAAHRFRWGERRIEVHAESGIFGAERVWIAAGALHSPDILERSIHKCLRRATASDHVFCYLGYTDEQHPPAVRHTLSGLWLQAWYGNAPALYTLRPARFGFRSLDSGIEQRAVFGLPTGSAIAKVARRLSAGLLAEALFNRFGLFSAAPRYSAYAQVPAPDAYEWRNSTNTPLTANTETIRKATDLARANQPFQGLVASRRSAVHIPGIHLHHTLEIAALRAAGVNEEGSPVQVVDASAIAEIGSDHHSFKMLVAAASRARRSLESL